MKARGLRVTFYPFILMDVPPGNTPAEPVFRQRRRGGQPAFPWRGRITCSPAAGFAGTVDKTATAASQVAAFFGAATPSELQRLGRARQSPDRAAPRATGACGAWCCTTPISALGRAG